MLNREISFVLLAIDWLDALNVHSFTGFSKVIPLQSGTMNKLKPILLICIIQEGINIFFMPKHVTRNVYPFYNFP